MKDKSETKFKYILEEDETVDFNYNVLARQLSCQYEIAYQLKRIADSFYREY